MTTRTQELKFSRGGEYDNRVEIDIKLKQVMSDEDYKVVLAAANKIMTYAGKYIVAAPEKKK